MCLSQQEKTNVHLCGYYISRLKPYYLPQYMIISACTILQEYTELSNKYTYILHGFKKSEFLLT
jgi:hypothetical protein